MKNFSGLTNSDLSTLISILEKYSEVEEALLFGSRAKGNFKTGSDVDVVVKGKQLTHDIIASLSYELNEETTMPYHFDILNFASISNPDLVEHINRAAKKIY